jgi:hypothetical protein
MHMTTHLDSLRSGDPATARKTARGLAWFSVGLGLAEILAPRMISRLCGVTENPGLVRLYGLREVATGIGLFRSSDARPWLWARVAGDALDMATLAGADVTRNSEDRRMVAMLNVAAVTAVDVHTAMHYEPEQMQPERVIDYSDRSGFPRSPDEMRGLAKRANETMADLPG